MTVLANTAEHLVEYESRTLTIARKSDGKCIALTGKGIAGEFRACLKTHTPERTIETFLRLVPKATWQPLYKPDALCLK